VASRTLLGRRALAFLDLCPAAIKWGRTEATGRDSIHCATSLSSHATEFSARRRRFGKWPARSSDTESFAIAQSFASLGASEEVS
jgi:hypothetical protein